MSPGRHTPAPPGGCGDCERRSWLLGELAGALEYCARDRARLLAVLALGDEELLDALAGRRREELRARHASFEPSMLSAAPGARTICRHRRGFPASLSSAHAPWLLHVAGDLARLVEVPEGPSVAILGSTRPSDYGSELARGLARGLAASGVSVLAALADGVAAAAQRGVLEARGRPVALLGDGLASGARGARGALYRCVLEAGCAVSELPGDCGGRCWGPAAAERILVELAQVTIVVEALDSERGLAPARIAQGLGRCVAAVPGRVGSPLAGAGHRLLVEGASLVRGPADVLELLHSSDEEQARRPACPVSEPELPARLRATLERVGGGCDTPDALLDAGEDAGALLARLSELELMGLLRRGHGGRYLRACPAPPAARAARRRIDQR